MPQLRLNREELDELYDFLVRHRTKISGALLDVVEAEAMRPVEGTGYPAPSRPARAAGHSEEETDE